MTTEDVRPPNRAANRVLAGLILVFGAVVFAMTVFAGRADSALLFVALPALLAAALAVTPGRTTHGRVFRLTTIALLLAAVAFHEGAICVVLAAPLVYGVAHGTTALARLCLAGPRTLVVLPLPLLLVAGVEGARDDWRVRPDQAVEVTRVVALGVDEVRARIAAGPRPVPTGSLALRLLGVPQPRHVLGDGLTPGDRWTFGYHGSSHGPGGEIVTEVADSAPGRLSFRIVADTAITARWFDWRGADLRWRPLPDGHTEVRLALSYRRGLDPSWYFGPMQDRLLHAGGGHLLDMLALR